MSKTKCKRKNAARAHAYAYGCNVTHPSPNQSLTHASPRHPLLTQSLPSTPHSPSLHLALSLTHPPPFRLFPVCGSLRGGPCTSLVLFVRLEVSRSPPLVTKPAHTLPPSYVSPLLTCPQPPSQSTSTPHLLVLTSPPPHPSPPFLSSSPSFVLRPQFNVPPDA